jgi:(p)ppGpp synthase/HD superfamily hydrolase
MNSCTINDGLMLAKALRIAAAAFEQKFDKGGYPYMLHCLAVMDGVRHRGFHVMTAAVLHDLLEDCPEWTAARMRQEGFSEELVALVELLTRRSGEEYSVYLARLAACSEAKAIKLADLRHNMQLTRLTELTEKSVERLKKYHEAYKLLTGRDE